jgi:UDP-galactopyranose mutase
MQKALIVGAGPFGCTVAHCLARFGWKVTVLDKREHIAGNTYDETCAGVRMQRYGAHIFHTNDLTVWEFVNRFGAFTPYEHRVRATNGRNVYSIPFDMNLMHRLWGVTTPAEARKHLEGVRVPCESPRSLAEWCMSQVGREIYEAVVAGYTQKQWGRRCEDLPASIIKRLPVRFAWDDRYFTDRFQGMPTDGYTALFENMLEHANVVLGEDYLARDRHRWDHMADVTIYSGPIDQFFGCEFGPLEYRSLRFEHEAVQEGTVEQGIAVMNFTAADVSHTRRIEWSQFPGAGRSDGGIITTEYPDRNSAEPYYPIRDERNVALYERYAKLAGEQSSRFVFGGRLGSYVYYDMHQVIAQGLVTAARILGFPRSQL